MPSELSATARRLAGAIEPVAGQVYFSPECHRAYVELGFGPSPRTTHDVALPDGPAYFTSRGSVMGQVAPEVVAAAFAVFSPGVVARCVELGWGRTDAATICAARDRGAIAQLHRILGPEPDGVHRALELLERAVEPLRAEGKPLFAGLRSQPVPDDPLGAVWRLSDCLREHRGDVHTMSWVTAGCDAVEIGLLTELYWGLPLRSYTRTRAWTHEELQAGVERLRAANLIDAEERFTDLGRELRELIEVGTDRLMGPAIRALGDEADELAVILDRWGTAIKEANGYLRSGPHDLATRTTR